MRAARLNRAREATRGRAWLLARFNPSARIVLRKGDATAFESDALFAVHGFAAHHYAIAIRGSAYAPAIGRQFREAGCCWPLRMDRSLSNPRDCNGLLTARIAIHFSMM